MSNFNDIPGEGPAKLEEERGIPPINGRKRGGKIGKYLGVAALVGLVGAMLWLNLKPKAQEPEKAAQVSETRRGLPALQLDETPAPPPPAQAPAAPPAVPGALPPAQAVPGKPAGPTPEELLLERRKRAPIIAFGGKGNLDTPTGQPGAQASGDSDEGALGASLKGTKTDAMSAVMLTDRNFLIAKGTFFDCALITALSSTVPGMTSCRLTRNVYSDNGKVLLLERGSIVEGEYRSGQMRQGMDRIFVLWTRVRTPKGVAIRLDSPGADELGRSGLPGWIDTHFWSRYGGALLLSLVDSGTQYAIAQQKSGSSGDTISFGGVGDATKDAASIALQNSINIPPTLNKNQGDLINIYVARDLDFRSVYDLSSGN